MSHHQKSCLVQTQVWWDFSPFQLTVQLGDWGSMQGREKDLLRQAQELSLLCLRKLVLSSNHIFEPKTAKKPKNWRVSCKGGFVPRQPTWQQAYIVSTICSHFFFRKCIVSARQVPCAALQKPSAVLALPVWGLHLWMIMIMTWMDCHFQQHVFGCVWKNKEKQQHLGLQINTSSTVLNLYFFWCSVPC